MKSIPLLLGALGLVAGLLVGSIPSVFSADAAPTPVAMACSRPVLDVATGQPVSIGGIPWYAEMGDTVWSHEWQGQPRYQFGNRRYHYVGGVAGPNRTFIVEDCTQQPSAGRAAPAPQVTRLAPDTYVFSHTGYTSMFIVTDQGVIVGDPMGPNRAQLLKAAIEAVTPLPVRYVVYSHDHADHNSGGGVFRDTAQFVSHSLAAPKIAARNDLDSPVPTITFDDRMTLRLGRTSVELLYTGRNHSDNSIVLYYPAQRVAFAVDFVPINDLPFRGLGDTYVAEWLDSLRQIEALNIDTIVPGHGNPGPKSHATQVREYFQDLIRAIEDAEKRGLAPQSPAMTSSVRAALYPKYGNWLSFGPYLPENIKGIYDNWKQFGRFSVN